MISNLHNQQSITENIPFIHYCVTFTLLEIKPQWTEITTIIDFAYESTICARLNKDNSYLILS